MTTEHTEQHATSLGQLLKSTRVARGLEIEHVCDETKISISVLRAMEADDYSSLPADPFAKGFYSLYAEALQLDADEVLNRFLIEKQQHPDQGKTSDYTQPPYKAAQKVSNMAEPSSVSPLSSIGFFLFLLLLLGGGVCWYFDINPATYISEKIRGIQRSTEPAGEEQQGDDSESRYSPSGSREEALASHMPAAAGSRGPLLGNALPYPGPVAGLTIPGATAPG